MKKINTGVGYGVALACTVFALTAQSAQPVQVLTLDQLNQFNRVGSSAAASRATRHHHQPHRNVLMEPIDSHKSESGDPIAAFASDMSSDKIRPSGSRGKADVRPQSVTAGFYRVNLGDTVAHIATAYGRKPRELMAWNSLKTRSLIQPGQVLRVAPPVEAHSDTSIR